MSEELNSEFGDLEMSDILQPDLARLSKQLERITGNLTKMQVSLAELNLRNSHLVEGMENSENRTKKEIEELRRNINTLSDRLGVLEKLIWKAVGATAIVALLLPYLFKLL